MFVRSRAAVLLLGTMAWLSFASSSGKSAQQTENSTSTASSAAGLIGSESGDQRWQVQLRELGAQRLARGWVLPLLTASYPPNVVSFRPSNTATIDSAARLLHEFSSARAVAEGHTDSRGPSALNERLSRARAEAVCGHLQQHGVEASRVQAMGFADRLPIASNATVLGRAKNRRVDLLFSDVSGRFSAASATNASSVRAIRPNYGHHPLHRRLILGGGEH